MAQAPPDLQSLVQTYQREIWRYLRYLGCEEFLAEDLTQETFLAVMKKPFEVYSPESTSAYLRTVARNLFLKHIRKTQSHPENAEVDASERAWSRFSADDGGDSYLEALRGCLETLDERSLKIIEMRFRERASRKDMAESLDMDPEAVKTALRRAKERLHQCVEGKLGDE